jgi:hypothetical protein
MTIDHTAEEALHPEKHGVGERGQLIFPINHLGLDFKPGLELR